MRKSNARFRLIIHPGLSLGFIFRLNKFLTYNYSMTTHQMNLQSRYFNYIKNGTKRIELRLNDEKRRQLQLGDTLVFTDSEGESLSTKITGLLHYQDFASLFQDFPIELLSDVSMSKTELLNVLNEFYPAEKQHYYGVLGIRIEL